MHGFWPVRNVHESAEAIGRNVPEFPRFDFVEAAAVHPALVQERLGRKTSEPQPNPAREFWAGAEKNFEFRFRVQEKVNICCSGARMIENEAKRAAFAALSPRHVRA